MPVAEDGSTVSDSFYDAPAVVPLDRGVAAAVRQLADGTSTKMSSAADAGARLILTVTVVTPGAARGGLDLAYVDWRGATTLIAGYASTYVPVVGDRVVCDHIDDQLLIAYRLIGQP